MYLVQPFERVCETNVCTSYLILLLSNQINCIKWCSTYPGTIIIILLIFLLVNVEDVNISMKIINTPLKLLRDIPPPDRHHNAFLISKRHNNLIIRFTANSFLLLLKICISLKMIIHSKKFNIFTA